MQGRFNKINSNVNVKQVQLMKNITFIDIK